MTDQNLESNSAPTYSRHAAVLRWLEMQSLRENYARLQKTYGGLDRDQRNGWWLANVERLGNARDLCAVSGGNAGHTFLHQSERDHCQSHSNKTKQT